MTDPVDPVATAALRRFNRSWTRRIGVLREGLAASAFPLAESRLLWELAHRETASVTALAADLDLDLGYTSRLVRRFRERGLVAAERAPEDGRRRHLRLTAKGRRAFAPLDRGSEREAAALLAGLGDADRARLVAAMATIEATLDPAVAPTPPPAPAPTFLLRASGPGDLGWIVERHGALYAAEQGWDGRFEAAVARIAADVLDRFDPAREACWIAERDGRRMGSVVLVQARHAGGEPIEGVAQLRLLLLEPDARGHGLGGRLVAECERFARARGYRRMVLWTHSVLEAARALYARAGWTLVASEPHAGYGRPLVGERWELPLADAERPEATMPANFRNDRRRRR